MFESVPVNSPDAIFGLNELFKNDTNAQKINLTVGVYKDASGQTPIMKSVKLAEQILLDNSTTKSYLPIDGSPAYRTTVAELILGRELSGKTLASTAQTPGGTVALRVAGELAGRVLGVKTVWMSNPTWANHPKIFGQAGLEIKQYDYLDESGTGLDFNKVKASLAAAQSGDAVLLHTVCHNPTGVDLSSDQWAELGDLLKTKSLLPIFDFAYQGFGEGLEQDATPIRRFVGAGGEAIICNSFSKNFGLYGERVGGITAISQSVEAGVRGVNGKHDRTWLSCEGTGRYSDESWSVTLGKLLATSVSVDEDLLTALPTSLAPPVRQMNYRGLLNVQGEITVAGVHQASSPEIGPSGFSEMDYFSTDPTMAWDLNFAMNNAKMLVGLPLESVFGAVQLQGIYDGKRAESTGELAIDSLSIHGAQITDVKGPIWMDNDRVSAGTLVNPPAQTVTGAASQARQSLTGTLYGGLAKLDATMANDSRGEFYIQTTMADGNIKDACLDFAPGVKHVEGHGFAAVRMGGSYDDYHSYKGDGTIELRDAKIYELPAMLSLLKLLNVGRTDRTAFDSSSINFMINGTDIDFERIELVGDAISLIGNGRMNLNQDLDLNFYSIVGRNRIRIPLLNELYHAGSQQIMWISVDGTIAHPKMSREVLPQLNDSIRQLFQSPERQNSFQSNAVRAAGFLQPAGAGGIR